MFCLKTSLDAYMQCLALERKGKSPDVFIVRGLYERAIAEAEKRRFASEENTEQALRTFWLGYIDFLVRKKEESLVSCSASTDAIIISIRESREWMMMTWRR